MFVFFRWRWENLCPGVIDPTHEAGSVPDVIKTENPRDLHKSHFNHNPPLCFLFIISCVSVLKLYHD